MRDDGWESAVGKRCQATLALCAGTYAHATHVVLWQQ